MIGRHLWLWVPIAWMAGLYALSGTPAQQLGTTFYVPHLDKLAHAIIYGGLVVCFWPWGGFRTPPKRWIPFAAAAAMTFGIAEEIHQSFVPGRAVELLDVVANLTGIALAAWFCSRRWSRYWACRILLRMDPEDASNIGVA